MIVSGRGIMMVKIGREEFETGEWDIGRFRGLKE
jgi:hypothetical protein